MKNDLWLILAVIGGALILLLPLLKIMFMPVKLILKIGVNSLIGFALLWLINTFGGLVGFFLPINIVTIVTAGFLGVPGVIMLGLIKYVVLI